MERRNKHILRCMYGGALLQLFLKTESMTSTRLQVPAPVPVVS